MKRKWFAFCAVLALILSVVNTSRSSAQDPMEGKGRLSIGIGFSSKGFIFRVDVVQPKPMPAPAIDATSPMLMPAYLEELLKLVGDALSPAVPEKKEAAVKDEKNRPVEVRLFEQVNVRIKEVPLQQAIKQLAYVSGVRMVPDYAALKNARVNLDAPVSLTVEHTSVHTAFQQLLNPQRLTYEIENDVVKIIIQERNAPIPGQREAKVRDEKAQRLFEIGERHRRAGDLELARKFYQQVHLMNPTCLHGRVAIARLVEIEERTRDTSEEQGDPARKDDPEQSFQDMRDRSVPLGLVEVSY